MKVHPLYIGQPGVADRGIISHRLRRIRKGNLVSGLILLTTEETIGANIVRLENLAAGLFDSENRIITTGWSAASGGNRIPEREYLVPTTLRKVLYKYFPHASGLSGRRATKPQPDLTIFLALEYTLLFDSEEDPIPPPRLGRLGKPPIFIADEDFRLEFRQEDDNRDTIKVPSPTSYTSTLSNSALDDQFSPTTLKPLLTHSENSKQLRVVTSETSFSRRVVKRMLGIKVLISDLVVRKELKWLREESVPKVPGPSIYTDSSPNPNPV
ncbi:hypothetical protein HOY82DRAFT_605810 [Tuber indicum]|nr:hypothetical protein HOY82DRAFT_605810 [Tuber indicum]